MLKHKGIVSRLSELKRPIRFDTGHTISCTVVAQWDYPDGRLWVNTAEECIVRIQGMPANSLVSYSPDGKMLDITIRS